MYKNIDVKSMLNEIFKPSRDRPNCTYMYRIVTMHDSINSFLVTYKTEALKTKSVFESHIPNPGPADFTKYTTVIDTEFKLEKQSILKDLRKWIPGTNGLALTNLTESIYQELLDLKNAGKNESALKTAYIKMMCWIKQFFSTALAAVGNTNPKILFEINPTVHELAILSVLSKAGCDVILFIKEGESDYLKIDPQSKKSKVFHITGETAISSNYKISPNTNQSQVVPQVSSQRSTNQSVQRPSVSSVQSTQVQRPVTTNFVQRPVNLKVCTNTWLSNGSFEEVKKLDRGSDICNVFVQYNGVWSRSTYLNDLYQFYNTLKSTNRQFAILDTTIELPRPDETNQVKRQQYSNAQQMINDLASQIRYDFSSDLQALMTKAFCDIMLEESQSETALNKIINKAVFLICWLRRYQSQILVSWKKSNISCFIYLGGCKTENEVLFMRLLSKLPIDVIILNPENKSCITPKDILIVDGNDSIKLDKYPTDPSQFRVGTVAYHAERDLDTLLYQDSGMYRNRQYVKANALTLSTMYEEIDILWKQELKFRPGFSTGDTVTVPVLFAKVSGVKDGNIKNYWSSIGNLITQDTVVVTSSPYIRIDDSKKQLARLFLTRNGVDRDRIKSHNSFQYSYLRDDTLDYMFDKLDLLLKNKTIKDTYSNGIEYDIIATALNLPKNIVRLIQAFDFTKTNPKMIYILTDETVASLEDAILVSYLNLIGFDIVFFVPTGYQSIEKYLDIPVEEHQIGSYVYDTKVPMKITQQSQTETKKPFSKLKELFS